MSDWKNVQYKDGKYRTSDEGGGGSSTFAGLDDVSFANLQNGQVPKYNSTTQKWENADESGGGGTVTDVTVDGASVVNQQGVAEITMPNIPVQDVTVDGTSVVNQQGVAQISIPTPPAPDYPVTDVKVNGTSVVSNKQASITSYKEVTQAQYEALPDSKLSDNILYAIKDGGQAVDGFPPLIYSDEEREIGIWRDGKPLYQKTYHFTSPLSIPTNSWTDTGISNTGIQKIIFGFGNDEFDNGDVLQSNSFMYLSFAVNVQNSIRVLNSRDAIITLNYITLQYTKTADTPGSGTWTTQGALAHHYSTTEHIIGTWIDGKPLYEKVFNISDTSCANNQWEDTGISKGSVKNIVKVVGFYGDNVCFNFLGAKAESTDTNIMVLNTRGSAISLNRLILQYTKTTD